MNDPERDPWPSVSEHPVEATLRDAEADGLRAIASIRMAQVYADVPQWFESQAQSAVENAVSAASWYHEAQRLAGECPECGAIFTDPWGGRHYNTSVGCCIEPPEPDGEAFRGGEAAAYEREQMANIQRTLK